MSVQPWHQGTPERDPAELAEESARRRAEAKLEDWARKPMTYNPINNPPGGQAPQAAAEAPVDKLTPALERALANPRRLNTPARQCAAFLRQVPRCTTISEAAARANVNRGTLYRWRAKDPDFAGRWDKATLRQADEVSDNVVLRAGHPEKQPVFYAGKQVGERQRYNDRLQIHIQKRLDSERHRAEDRAERRELAALRHPPIDEAALAERLVVLIEKRQRARSPSATPEATPAAPEGANENNGLAGES